MLCHREQLGLLQSLVTAGEGGGADRAGPTDGRQNEKEGKKKQSSI